MGDRRRADPGSEELGDAPAAPRKSPPVSNLHEAVAWAKNVFQKRALEKHLLAGDWAHLPHVSPPRFLSKQGHCCQEGTGDGEDCPAAL